MEVALILEKFERVLASQDEIAIKKAAQVFKAELASLERWTDY